MSSKKARKKGTQASRSQQQQEAAARRRAPATAAGRDRSAAQAAAESQPPKPQVQRGGTRYYLDVSAVRIQDWLARTPDLKFRRGASVLLAEATARDAWEDALPPGMRWNEEAGSLDGVVSLVAEDEGADAAACCADAACAVARRMREKMPQCPIQAVAGTGESYAAAYEKMARARRDGMFVVDAPPAPAEVVLAKPCDQCRAATAVHPGVTIISGERAQDLCQDCKERFEAAGGTKGDRARRSPRPERRMKEALAALGMTVKGFPDNFTDMAAAGRRDSDDASTQVALIYADGNKVGAFLAEATKYTRAGGSPGKAEIVPAIDGATVGALAGAIVNRFSGWARPPVLANLAGGDDLLVSVPAPDAWLFVRTLLAAFGTRISGAARRWPRDVREKVPSMSAGMVFHHLKDPFSDLVRLAGEQCHLAKQARRGREAAVAFLDLTADGGQAPPGREPLTLAYLDQHAGELRRIETLPASRRETLLTLYRQGAIDDFIRRVTDLDNQPLWEVIAGPGAGAADARQTLTGHPDKRAELRNILDVARYWHSEPRTEPETGLRSRLREGAA